MFDIAVIGFGPTGATLANLLGQAGLSVLVLERESAIYPLPRAVHFDGEVMRIFQSAGLRDAVESMSRAGLKGMHFVNADGDTLLIRGGTTALGPHGCASNYYFHQPALEAVLREGVGRFAHVDVRLQHDVTELIEEQDHVGLRVDDLAQGITRHFSARYVVGCDGARSLVRKQLGSPMKDLGLHQPWLVFDVLLKNDTSTLPDHTVQHCNPSRPMTFCNVTGRRRRWEIMLMPGDDPAELVRPETLWKLVNRWMTPDDAEIERAVIYTFHSVLAEGWRRNRLLLAGDAAHQTPPFLGQGMCAGLRDASNLAWKLEAVLSGRADDRLLDSYESERAPHVHDFIALAVRLGDIIQTTDPALARERDARFKAGQPETFQFPSPRLGPGVWWGDNTPVGRPFPQPLLDDGKLLDTRLGVRMAVIGDPLVIDGVNPSTRATWQRWDTCVLPAADSALRSWLETQGAAAALLRPDRYILGLANSAAELDALTARLPLATGQACCPS